jgi:hypothetical protein
MVPGNHDIPLYDVARRFLWPLARYRHHIDPVLCPWFEDDEVAVLGLNTARSLTFMDGRINAEQMDLLRARFAAVPLSKTRILVTHHPLFAMPIGSGGELSEAVGRHEQAVNAVCEAGVRIALAGHFHRTYAEAARKMVEKAGAALVIQAGTATSTRLRNNEPQSFNWIHTNGGDEIELQVIVWGGSTFERANHIRYRFVEDDWVRQDIRGSRGVNVSNAPNPGRSMCHLPASKADIRPGQPHGCYVGRSRQAAHRRRNEQSGHPPASVKLELHPEQYGNPEGAQVDYPTVVSSFPGGHRRIRPRI